MRPEHLYNKELNVNDGAYYRRWAAALGPFMATLIDRVLKSAKHEEQAYRSCAGILHMCKDVPRDVIEEVAAKCLEANAAKYTYFKRALSQAGAARSEGGALRDKRLPEHDNIRGKGHYQ
jgi:hypothetical protein